LIEDRFDKKGIPFYVDYKHGALHAKCTDGEMWTILSGQESKWSCEMPPDRELEPEFINVTIVGSKLKPSISAIKVNKMLEKIGCQTV